MKFSSLFIALPTLYVTLLDASSTKSSPSVKLSKANLSESELEQLADKNEKDLEAWLVGKRFEYDYDIIMSDTEISQSSPNASSKSSPSASSTASNVSKFDQKMLVSLDEALRSKNYSLSIKLIQCIPNWKMTFQNCNFSVLSLIAKFGKKKFIGKLDRSDSLDIFEPLISGNQGRATGGYFLALSLFNPTIQFQVMSKLIENASNLRGVLLMNSIYFNLHESVINLLINSGAIINFEESDKASLLKSLPSYSNDSSVAQVSITKRFFMNFSNGQPLFPSWERHTSPEPEINFLMGMFEAGLPEEIGALRAAFENYSPVIVMKLIGLSPLTQMTKYHLAHLLAKNPEKQSGYPAIESLVDSQLVFDRLNNGESDLVSLAYLSALSTSDQVRAVSEFLKNTKMFESPRISNDKTLSFNTSKDFRSQYDIYELPSNPAHVFFLTACKWNISDEAFALLWKICKNINNKLFYSSKNIAMKWALANNLFGKVQIMSQN